MLNELLPLVAKAKELEGNLDADDIYQHILVKAQNASTPSMAQSVCEYVQTMSHPKAWGDRFVTGFEGIVAWSNFLSQLSAVAEQCWKQISENHAHEN